MVSYLIGCVAPLFPEDIELAVPEICGCGRFRDMGTVPTVGFFMTLSLTVHVVADQALENPTDTTVTACFNFLKTTAAAPSRADETRVAQTYLHSFFDLDNGDELTSDRVLGGTVVENQMGREENGQAPAFPVVFVKRFQDFVASSPPTLRSPVGDTMLFRVYARTQVGYARRIEQELANEGAQNQQARTRHRCP